MIMFFLCLIGFMICVVSAVSGNLGVIAVVAAFVWFMVAFVWFMALLGSKTKKNDQASPGTLAEGRTGTKQEMKK